VRADAVVGQVKCLGELLDCVARATQQRDDVPARALEEFLVPVRSQCSPFLCWSLFTVAAEVDFIKKLNKYLIYCLY
jgi:hypothetical protein